MKTLILFPFIILFSITTTNAKDALNVMKVNAPNGGESWAAGSVHTITWVDVSTPLVATASIEYSTNGGSTWITIANNVPNVNGNVNNNYSWTLPSISSSSQCKVKVTIGIHSDISDNNFTITASAGTAITENSFYNTVHAFPNPANSIVTINGSELLKKADGYGIKIVNLQGQEVYSETKHEFSQPIDISSFADGLYFINIIDENKSVVVSLKQMVSR